MRPTVGDTECGYAHIAPVHDTPAVTARPVDRHYMVVVGAVVVVGIAILMYIRLFRRRPSHVGSAGMGTVVVM